MVKTLFLAIIISAVICGSLVVCDPAPYRSTQHHSNIVEGTVIRVDYSDGHGFSWTEYIIYLDTGGIYTAYKWRFLNGPGLAPGDKVQLQITSGTNTVEKIWKL